MDADPPRLADLTLGSVLGRGGAATVYAATEDSTGRAVAVKVLDPRIAADPQVQTRFRRESRIAATVEHPGVVRLLRTAEADGALCLVLERVDGRDLQRLVDAEGALPWRRAGEIAAAVADALAAVHAAGIVHGDVTPANVLIDATGAPRLTDFGLARPAVPPSASLTGDSLWARTDGSDVAEETVLGTLRYMAPEQWRNEPAGVGTDIYGLGGVLVAALTGAAPYPAGTIAELVHGHVVAPPPAPGGPFDAVLARAMAKNPAERFTDATAVAVAIRAVLAGRGRSVRGRRPGRRVLVAAGAVVVLAAAGVVAGVTLRSGHASTTPERSRAVVCAEAATLRDKPRGHAVVAVLRHGSAVTVDASAVHKVWLHVRDSAGHAGWTLSQYTKEACPS